MLQTENLSIGYTNKTIASDISLSLEKGEMACLIGENGSGKSTLLRTLAGLQVPISGRILLENSILSDISVQEKARLVSLVLTERLHLSFATAFEVAALGRFPYTNFMGTLQSEDRVCIENALQHVGADHLSKRWFNELSDGEKQKVMIARALAQSPKLLILDEPTAFLDFKRRIEVMKLLRTIADQGECAILLSTHELDLATQFADTIWHFDASRYLHTLKPPFALNLD